MFLRILFSIFFISFITHLSYTQGIKGVIRDEDGAALPYATLYIEEINSGTVANINGEFEFRLNEGTYRLKFQYAGYESVNKTISISQEWQSLTIVMKPQTLMMREVVVNRKGEDPAYAIMRKAIAKSKYHLQYIDRYQAQVYIKGKGRVLDVPFFLRKELAKEGLDSTTLFISESVSILEYERPNTYNERVISVFKSGEENSTSPNSFIYGSFYEDQVSNSISPLSQNALSYYHFSYESAFMEDGYLINKIQVIPKVKAPNVFSGYIQIVEDLWSIYALDLSTTIEMGIKFGIKQQYAPIEKAWMPVSQQIKAEGNIFGIKFEYDYLASLSDYQIKINPDMQFQVAVVDEKSQKTMLKELKKNEELVESFENLSQATDKKVARKELRKMMKEYEKQELKQQEEPEVISERNRTIDSLAYKKSLEYWNEIRPIPLTEREIKGYQKQDSLARAERVKEEGVTDSTAKNKKFDYGVLLSGKNIKTGSRSSLDIKSPIVGINFNTVEGLLFEWPITFSLRTKELGSYSLKTVGRYSSLRNQFSAYARIGWNQATKHQLYISSGRYIFQYNEEEPINPLFNSFTTLFLGGNFMKILEKDFIKAYYSWKPNEKWNIYSTLEYGERRELMNRSTFEIIDYPWRDHTPNIPINNELDDASFDPHRFMIWTAGADWKPFLKYRIRNGQKQVINDSSPVFRIDYKKGLSIFDSQVNYDFVQAGYQQKIKIGVKGIFDINVMAGAFLNTQELFFPDFKHFPGNLAPIQFDNPAGKYRRLDYYLYSTTDWFVAPHVHYQFRKLLLTQITELRFMGIKENLLVNALYTPQSGLYHEFGYVIDNIYRLFSLEFVTSFENAQYIGFGMRLGVSTTLQSLINNN